MGTVATTSVSTPAAIAEKPIYQLPSVNCSFCYQRGENDVLRLEYPDGIIREYEPWMQEQLEAAVRCGNIYYYRGGVSADLKRTLAADDVIGS